jgi:FkbM family methyltransferase
VGSLTELLKTMRRQTRWWVRDRFPNRKVVRDVQGVRLVLPWSHRLPDYAGPGSPYGQNLVELARLLAKAAPPLTVLDVGANVGDSALQILNAADGRVLCIEADTYYLDFLHRNVDNDDRITVVESLLAVDEAAAATTAVRTGGTTRFVRGAESDAMASISPARLRDTHPDFAQLRLVKSDTDGYDVALVPAIAEAWSEARPVLFFEYDPYLTRIAGYDPLEVWRRLEALGYLEAAVWTHAGTAVGRMTTAEAAARSRVLDDFPARRPNRRTYWDVALAHQDDDAGLEVLDTLVHRAQVR